MYIIINKKKKLTAWLLFFKRICVVFFFAQMLWKNFLRNYRSNRAPLYLNLHSPWLNTDYQLEAMDEFIQKMVSMDDVYLVTMSQALAWQKEPTPKESLAEFEPWKCPGFQPHVEDSKQCSLTFRHKTAPGHGYGTGIETEHQRRRAQLRNILAQSRHSDTSSRAGHGKNDNSGDSSNTGNEDKNRGRPKLASHDLHKENQGHTYHHHDHRTHKPWFLRGSASALNHSCSITAMFLVALTNMFFLFNGN